MFSHVNDALLFTIVLIWTLVITWLLLIAIYLFIRRMCIFVQGKTKITKYTIVQIEEGHGDMRSEVDTLEKFGAQTEEQNDDNVPRMTNEGDMDDAHPTVKYEEKNRSDDGKRKKVLVDENTGQQMKKEVREDRDKEHTITTTCGTNDHSLDVDTSVMKNTSSSIKDVYPQDVEDEECNVKSLKDCKLSRSTDEILSRPVPTPRKKVKPSKSQCDLSSSKASLMINDDGQVEMEKDERNQENTNEPALSGANISLFDDLESIFSLSNEIEMIPQEPQQTNEACIPVSCKQQETDKTHVKDDKGENNKILHKSILEKEDTNLECNKSDMCASKLPPLPLSPPRRGRRLKKFVSRDDAESCKEVFPQNYVHIDRACIDKTEQETRNLTITTELSPEPAKQLMVMKDDSTPFKPLNRQRKGSMKPTSPPPKPPLHSSPKESAKMETQKKNPIILAQTHSVPLAAQVSSERSKDITQIPLLPKMSTGSKKITKPANPPPPPPMKATLPAPPVKFPETSTLDDLEPETFKQTAFPFTQIRNARVESQPVYDEIADRDQQIKKTTTALHIYDEIREKHNVPKMSFDQPRDLRAVVQNANMLQFQKQGLRNIGLGEKEFVNPVYVSAYPRQGELQETNNFTGNHISASDGNLPPQSKQKLCVSPSSFMSKQIPGQVQNSVTNPSEPTNNLKLKGYASPSFRTDQYITAVATIESTSVYDTKLDMPEDGLKVSKEALPDDRQPLIPPVEPKPKVLNVHGVHLEDRRVGDTKKTSKPPVPRKPIKKS